jgi:hypothetical protein
MGITSRQSCVAPIARMAEREGIMAVAFYFPHSGFTAEKYDTAIKKLEEAGAGSPKGRTLHVALDTDGVVNVFDIWESQEDFDAFGQTLVPILTGLGVELSDPMVANVHNVIEG